MKLDNRFIYVRFNYNFHFPILYNIDTQPKTIYEGKYYKILEYQQFYAITTPYECFNPTAIVLKTKKLAVHQLINIANVLVLPEIKEAVIVLELEDLQAWLEQEIKNYEPEYCEPKYTNIPYILDRMHELVKELREITKMIEKSEKKVEIIKEKRERDDVEYWEYVLLV